MSRYPDLKRRISSLPFPPLHVPPLLLGNKAAAHTRCRRQLHEAATHNPALTFATFAARTQQLVDEVINNLLVRCMQHF